ncbi:hypothetical protein BD779DRAFT_1790564 [Infundibulicybe gibba]|nr:hypothetical protein BD779DRAFT_1790564 [Infundibulicybe gibba]
MHGYGFHSINSALLSHRIRLLTGWCLVACRLPTSSHAPSTFYTSMPLFDHSEQFTIHGSEFNDVGRDINKYITKNHNHVVNSNNTNSNNIIGSNNTIGSNNWSPPDPSYYMPYYEHHPAEWDDARWEYGYYPYRPDQGRSYSYAGSGGGRRPRSHQPRDASPADPESEPELPPMEEHVPRRRSGKAQQSPRGSAVGYPPEERAPRRRSSRAQQPPQEPTSGYPPPNVSSPSSHRRHDGDARRSTQYAPQHQPHSPNLQSSGYSRPLPAQHKSPHLRPNEGVRTNNPSHGTDSQGEYPPSRARHATTPHASAKEERRTTSDYMARGSSSERYS